MFEHHYHDFRYGVLHELSYRCADGHLIHDHFETIHYDDIVWG